MFQTSVISTLQSNSQTVIDQTVQNLELAGLQVMRSFDLKVARAAHTDCPCPYHGTDQCDCQMVVLLVYGCGKQPVTLVVHGHDDTTQITLVDTPDQQPDPLLIDVIMRAIQSIGDNQFKIASFKVEGGCHAG